ncbi:MAG: hypothetical protein COW84_06655 [Gammaproteobacteria bacterium CG22_combo_CG10-13_8_21_14_all_40_8]|nr:MAG: hypothetical protein COW84_06655 [Gammaproteobacteria bacterium CG22_combo_CG10-13_8_21_14_all_40_8]
MFKNIRVILLFAVALSLSLGYAQDSKIYKWKNAQGNIVYSQQPPEDKSIKFEVETIVAKKPSKTVQPHNLEKEIPVSKGKTKILMIKGKSKEILLKQKNTSDDSPIE